MQLTPFAWVLATLTALTAAKEFTEVCHPRVPSNGHGFDLQILCSSTSSTINGDSCLGNSNGSLVYHEEGGAFGSCTSCNTITKGSEPFVNCTCPNDKKHSKVASIPWSSIFASLEPTGTAFKVTGTPTLACGTSTGTVSAIPA